MMETEFYFDTAQIIALALRCILDIFLPFAAFYYLHKKHGGRWYPLLVGITATILLVVPRALLRNMFVPSGGGFLLQFFISALINALCEEMARYLAMRHAMPQHTGLMDGICYGLGHGGMESLVLSQYPLDYLWMQIRHRQYGTEHFTAGKTDEQLAAVMEKLQICDSLDVFASMEASIASICAFANHIAWSVLVLTAVRFAGCRKFLYLAIGLHILSHFGTIFLGILGTLVITFGICWMTYRWVKPYWALEYA